MTDNLTVVQCGSVAGAELDYINSVFAHNVAKISLARAIGRAAEDLPAFSRFVSSTVDTEGPVPPRAAPDRMRAIHNFQIREHKRAEHRRFNKLLKHWLRAGTVYSVRRQPGPRSSSDQLRHDATGPTRPRVRRYRYSEVSG